MAPNPGLLIAGQQVLAGERKALALPLGSLYSHMPAELPLQVICGKRAGPVLFVSAAVHGDELNGVEIIRRLLQLPQLQRLRGSLIAAPIVNLYGFLQQSRYLPDRRDLNRSFPGSAQGSLAARLARMVAQDILPLVTHGIDLHTGAVHRANLPQIRADLDDEVTLAMAKAFGSPVILNSALRDGSLRATAKDLGIPILVYEAGEALRFDDISIRGGVHGILQVMKHLGMLPTKASKPVKDPIMARNSSWQRAPRSGVFRSLKKLGQRVQRDELLGYISDPFGTDEQEVRTKVGGIIIGMLYLPLVHEGEALFHVAQFNRTDLAVERVESYQERLESNQLLDSDFPS